MTQAQKETLACELLAKHNPAWIPAIKELRDTLDCGLFEAKDLVDIARGVAPSKVRAASQAEKEAVAHEAWSKHKPELIATIKEIRTVLGADLQEAKKLYDIARGETPTEVPSSTLQLARKVIFVHGADRAARELAPRLNCSPEEAQAIVKLVSPKPSRTSTMPHYEWNARAAEKWLRSYAAHLRREAKYVSDNASGFAENEEEFRCGLTAGLGIDDENEQDKIIREMHEKRERANAAGKSKGSRT